MTSESTVRLTVEMTEQEASALAQFLKRVGHSDYRSLATNDDNAYLMLFAGEQVRKALADAGFAPR